jgi:predicted nucleotidyltransferase
MGTPAKPKQTATTYSSGVGDALFTRVQQRVLGILFGNSDRTFYANEIIRLADVGTGAVQRELARLESAGLVTVTRVGNQKHYQANAASPVFGELRALVLKTSGLADVLRAVLAPLAGPVDAAFIYGSVAKREDTSSSDVDVMIISDTLRYPDIFPALESASERLGRAVNPTVYTHAELDRRIERRNAFVTKVLAQPKIWLIGGEDDLAA